MLADGVDPECDTGKYPLSYSFGDRIGELLILVDVEGEYTIRTGFCRGKILACCRVGMSTA